MEIPDPEGKITLTKDHQGKDVPRKTHMQKWKQQT
jgi:hypothetical protein